jgi:hypothetical protein
MFYDFATRCREQTLESGVDTNSPVCCALNHFSFGINEQAEIPTRRTRNDAPAFDFTFGNLLPMKSNLV